jgi:hypothetical protein
MTVNIIHLQHRTDRLVMLREELAKQNIGDFKIWGGIIDRDCPYAGISKAHKQIVKYARDENLEEVLIGEDDVHFVSAGAFDFFLRNKPVDFDIYLAGIYNGEIKTDNTVDDFAALTLYIVNRRYYDIFLGLPENTHLDRAMRYTGRFVVCYPFAVTQHNGYSDNLKTYCNDDRYLLGRQLYRGN